MRLLRVQKGGSFSLTKDLIENIPPYAILSHTWGEDDQEVTIHDIQHQAGRHKQGYKKLQFCCQQTAMNGLQYFWVDTCCIDKSNNTELSEAINSMFRWYQNATQCYVYLSDVSKNDCEDGQTLRSSWKLSFKRSRWFTRGWTLQELIAPKLVTFFSAEGQHLGDKASLETLLHDITGIPIDALQGKPLSGFGIQERFSWQGARQTKRTEDRAYSLFGIFDVHLPLLYGEGEKKAFTRLQQEVDKQGSSPNSSSQQTAATDPRRTLLESLEFDQIDARHQSIRKEHANTCRWFLYTEQYRQWEERGSPHSENFLWIRGKPGAGKSTLMKFLLGQIKNRNRRRKSPDITVFFFFNARGGELEKSTIGLYRSLLWQLLNSQPDLQTVLDSSFRPGQQWTVQSLESLLEEAVQGMGETPTTCLIDALDECEEQQIRDMVTFLTRLSKDSPLHICFASRHYPHISVATDLSVVLEERDGHQEDIATYLSSALQIGHSRLAEEIRSELKEKACGVFMWVVLVVDILNKEYDTGRKHKLRERLQQLPGDLDALFRDILTRDTRNREGLLLCIQWVLFAMQPLTPKQLYLGIMAGTEPEYLPDCHSSETYSDDDARRYILDNSKGLAESTKSKSPTVQFIHESVRDFLLKEDGLSKVFPEVGLNVLGHSHEALKSCCLRYMHMEALVAIGKSSRNTAITTYPLLEYANQGILYHADRAGDNGVHQHGFLDGFPRPAWVQHYNVLQKHEVRRYTPDVSLLYILAEARMPALVRAYAHRQSCFEVEDERYGLPILAASAVKGVTAVRAMLEAEAERVPGFSFGDFCTELSSSIELSNAPSRNFRFKREKNLFHQLVDYGDEFISLFFLKTRHGDELQDMSGVDILIKAARRGFGILLKQLIDHGADVSAVDKDGQTVLHLVSIDGSVKMAKLLVDNGADVNAQGGVYGNALYAASARGHREIVRLLVDKGADVNAQGGAYDNVLYAASAGGHREIVRMLVDKGADVNAQGGHYGNALQAALEGGHWEIVRMLVENGADVNAQGGHYGNVLYAASAGGHREIVRMLVDKGADVNAQGGHYGNALQAALEGGHWEIVRMLVENGADVNAQGGVYRNALQAALEGGQWEIVRMLVENGADVNAQGGHYGNALQAASAGGHREIVRLLVENGADVNAQGGVYGNALQAASVGGHREIVQLLVDKGADVNAQGGVYGNALQAASDQGHREIVQLLLDKGADVNAQGGVYGNVLYAASVGGHREIVQLLLDKGADVNAQGGVYGNALQAASVGGHREIVQLLVDKGADVNAQGGVYGNALYAASARGHREIVQLLDAAKQA